MPYKTHSKSTSTVTHELSSIASTNTRPTFNVENQTSSEFKPIDLSIGNSKNSQIRNTQEQSDRDVGIQQVANRTALQGSRPPGKENVVYSTNIRNK